MGNMQFSDFDKEVLKKIEESGGDYDDIIEALELFGLEATLRM